MEIRKRNKKVFGVGVNDVDYNVYVYELIEGKPKRVWTCPYYKVWVDVLKRCFSSKFKNKRKTYKDCTISDDWLLFSNFIKWVDSQPNRDWKNCDLDKDLLLTGNKHYSPDTCVFIDSRLNQFTKDRGSDRGDFLLGVNAQGSGFVAKCSNPFDTETKGEAGRYLGYFKKEEDAHLAWKAKKHEYACMLAELQDDTRVAEALRKRFK